MTKFYSTYSTTIKNMIIIYITFHSQVLNNNIIKHLILRLGSSFKSWPTTQEIMFWRVNKSSSKMECLSICFLPLGTLISTPPSSCSRICSLRCWYILEWQNLRVPYLAASSLSTVPRGSRKYRIHPQDSWAWISGPKGQVPPPCGSDLHHSLYVEEAQCTHIAFSVSCRGHTATHLDWPRHCEQSLSQTARAPARMVTTSHIAGIPRAAVEKSRLSQAITEGASEPRQAGLGWGGATTCLSACQSSAHGHWKQKQK